MKTTKRLPVSSSEHAILEAIVTCSDTSAAVRTRAGIILKAAEGVPNRRIAIEISRGRAYVIHWINSFLSGGIRGLWDVERPGPRGRMDPDRERAIVADSLHGLPPGLRWNIRDLAFKHRVSLASVYRIWTKHGIAVETLGVDIDKLKISQDLLFGVTISHIAGLFYETLSPVLALVTTDLPFSEIRLSEASSQDLRVQTDAFLMELRHLAYRLIGPERPSVQKAIQFLNVLESKRKPDSRVHLLAGIHHTGVLMSDEVGRWLSQQPSFELHWAPNTLRGPQWSNWIQRWLRVICAFPVQAELVESLRAMTTMLNNLPSSEDVLDTIAFG